MKKSLFLVALAATMGFASCSNEENVAPVDNSPKAVSINLKNVIAATRNADAPVVDKTNVQLNSFEVFFVDDQGNLKKGKNIGNKNVNDESATDAEHYFTAFNTSDTDTNDYVYNTNFKSQVEGQIYHYLPSNVNKVVVVGNRASKWSAGVTTYEELKETLAISQEQDDTNLYLYAEADLTTQDGQDAAGHPLYKADLNLVPRVSRVEISTFEYKENPNATGNPGEASYVPARKYDEIKVEQVLFYNYYTSVADARVAAATDLWTLTVDNGTVFNHFEVAPSEIEGTNKAWNSDYLQGAADKIKETKLNAATNHKVEYGSTEMRPAYHFFPGNAEIASKQPLLVVKLSAKTGDVTTPLYLVTKSYTPAITTEEAKNYVVNFAFDDTDLSNPEKCVELTLTVQQWNVVPVTPDFTPIS